MGLPAAVPLNSFTLSPTATRKALKALFHTTPRSISSRLRYATCGVAMGRSRRPREVYVSLLLLALGCAGACFFSRLSGRLFSHQMHSGLLCR